MITLHKYGVKTTFERYGKDEVIIRSEYEVPGMNTEERFIKFAERVKAINPLRREHIKKYSQRETLTSKYHYGKVFIAIHQNQHIEIINNTLSLYGHQELNIN